MTPQQIHNRDAGKIVASIVRPTLEAGGKETDVLVLLESVVTGVLLALVKLGGDEKVLDVFTANVRLRMAALRLKDIKTEGKA